MAEIKVGDWVVRNKYPSTYIESGKAYKVTNKVTDTSYSGNWKIQLEGVEPMPNGSMRWFDPKFFIVVGAAEPKWEPGYQVVCVSQDDGGWPSEAAQIGGTYTIQSLSQTGGNVTLEETPFLYKKTHFQLIGSDVPDVPKPKPRVVIYNQQA